MRLSDEALSYVPASDTEKETQHIRLLLLLKFFDILEGTHLIPLELVISYGIRLLDWLTLLSIVMGLAMVVGCRMETRCEISILHGRNVRRFAAAKFRAALNNRSAYRHFLVAPR